MNFKDTVLCKFEEKKKTKRRKDLKKINSIKHTWRNIALLTRLDPVDLKHPSTYKACMQYIYIYIYIYIKPYHLHLSQIMKKN